MSIGSTSTYEYLKKHYGEETARKIIESRDQDLKNSSQEIHQNSVAQTLIQNMIDAGLYTANELSQNYSSSISNNHIDLESTQIRRILTNKRLFDQEKTNPNSILYRILAFDLFELNGADEKLISNKVLRYSDKINEYYKQKFGRILLDSKDRDVKESIDLINSDEFQQYYKFGYHSMNAQRHNLKIDAELLNKFSKHIFDDQEKHQFDLSIKNTLPSPNTYDMIDKTQKQHIVRVNMPKKTIIR